MIEWSVKTLFNNKKASMSTALIFPGQGSQEHNMGRKVAESSKEFMMLWEKAESISGLPLRAVYWESKDTEMMSNTKYLQPALTVANITLWQYFSKKVTPQCVAGHSLGEFSALVAAKVLSPEDAIELTSIRGVLMDEADQQGSMAAILRLNQKDVESIVKEVQYNFGNLIVIANYNTPSQFVISGDHSALSEAGRFVKEKKGRVIPLPVSGAFHSPFMEGVAETFSKYLAKKTWLTPRYPFYSNTNALECTTKDQIYNCMIKQMTSPVYWLETVIHQWKNGIQEWLEIGSKGILSRMIAPILESISIHDGFSTVFLDIVEEKMDV